MQGTNSDYNYFLKADLSSYKENEWLAISNRKIVAHGRGADTVHKKAKKMKPSGEILIVRVPPRRLVIY